MTTIYKICEATQWAQARHEGEFSGSAVDFADGYIHLSKRDQVAATAARHFAGMSGLVVVAIQAEELGAALKWEAARDGACVARVPEAHAAARHAERGLRVSEP